MCKNLFLFKLLYFLGTFRYGVGTALKLIFEFAGDLHVIGVCIVIHRDAH